MIPKPGGIADTAIQDALARVRANRDRSGLARLVDSDESLHVPAVQAALKRSLGRGSPEDIDQCHLLFLLLHDKGHRALATQAIGRTAPKSDGPPQVPAFHAQILAALGDTKPPNRSHGPHDSTDLARLRADLEELRIDAPLDLAADRGPPGASWSILWARCLSCGAEQSIVRPHYIDLRRNPDLRALIRARRNATECRSCGFHVLVPTTVWVQDPPLSSDALSAMSTFVRATDWLDIFQPPAWGLEKDKWRIVLEVRSSTACPDDATDAPGKIRFCSVVYDHDDLVSQVSLEGSDTFRMAAATLACLLEAGHVGMEAIDAQAHFLARAGKWSPVHLADPLPGAQRYLTASMALLSEALAIDQRCPSVALVEQALQSHVAWLALRECGPAAAAIARARDALRGVDDDRQRVTLSMLIDAAEGDLAKRVGAAAPGRLTRELAERLGGSVDGSLAQRSYYWRAASTEAVTLKNEERYADAIRAFQVALPEQLILHDEGRAEGDAIARETAIALSGTLANLAGALLDVPDLALEGLDSHKVAAWVAGLTQTTVPRIDANPDVQLAAAATALLTKALELSLAHEHHDYAATQTWRIATIVSRLEVGATDMLERWLLQAHQLAIRANHLEIACRAAIALADLYGRRGIPARALEYLEYAVGADSRLRVAAGTLGSGEDARSSALATAALRLTRFGGDVARCILLAEAQKNVRSAAMTRAGFRGAPRASSHGPEYTAYVELRRHILALEDELRIAEESDRDDLLTEIDRLRGEHTKIRRQLEASDPTFLRWSDARALALPTPNDCARILERLGPRTTLLGAHVADEVMWSYAIWDGGAVALRHDDWSGWRGDVGGMVADLAGGREPSADVVARVSTYLLAPLRDRLPILIDSDRVVVSVCPELAQLPYSWLEIGFRRLIELVVLSYSPGLAMLGSALEHPAFDPQSVLAVGYPERPRRPPYWSALEANAVADAFRARRRRGTVLVGSDATPDAVASAVADTDVVHFACHGRRTLGVGRRACLQLAAVDDSGDLTADRIAHEIAISSGALIVLAACETGQYDPADDDASDDLVPALLLAGAGTVIATTCNIWDGETLTFQRAFYERLLQGDSPADALAAVQRAALRGDMGPGMRVPKAWAAFTAHGR